MLKRPVNGTIGMLYDIIWEDEVKNPFAIILAVILMTINNYANPTSMMVNSVHMVLIIPIKT